MSPSLNAINATNPHAARKTKNNIRHIISVQLCFLSGPFQFTTSLWSAGGVPDEFPRPIASSGLCFVYFKTSFVISISTMYRKRAIVYTSINIYFIILIYWDEDQYSKTVFTDRNLRKTYPYNIFRSLLHRCWLVPWHITKYVSTTYHCVKLNLPSFLSKQKAFM